jgi:hypothetical protein
VSLAQMIAFPEAGSGPKSSRRPNVDDIMRLGLNSPRQSANGEHPEGVDFSKATRLLQGAWTIINQLIAGNPAAEGIGQSQQQEPATRRDRRAISPEAELEEVGSRLYAKQALIENLTYQAARAVARALIAEQQSGHARDMVQVFENTMIDTQGTLEPIISVSDGELGLRPGCEGIGTDGQPSARSTIRLTYSYSAKFRPSLQSGPSVRLSPGAL